jgi:hypothetical protein
LREKQVKERGGNSFWKTGVAKKPGIKKRKQRVPGMSGAETCCA